MITVKDLLSETKNAVHVSVLSGNPTTKEVANLHHVLGQQGSKQIYHTPNVTPEIKTMYQHSGINHKHFFASKEPVKTIFDAVDQTTKKTNAPIHLHVHPSQKDQVEKSLLKTHPNLKITVSSLPNDKDKQSPIHSSVTKEDAKTLKTESLEVGDYVTDSIVEGEILNIHPKYATVVSEGKEYRIWVDNLYLSENQPKRDQIYKDSFIFKGYRTKNFNRQLAESFREIAKESTDEYAVLACLQAFDYVLGVDDKTISENFNTARVQVERLRRYAKKINCPYLVEAVIAIVEEELLKYALIEDIKYTTVDRNVIANVIASVSGINITSRGIDPTNVVNQAVIKLKLQQLTSPGWKLLGRLLNAATKSGISWNKDTFSPSIQKEMGLTNGK